MCSISHLSCGDLIHKVRILCLCVCLSALFWLVFCAGKIFDISLGFMINYVKWQFLMDFVKNSGVLLKY